MIVFQVAIIIMTLFSGASAFLIGLWSVDGAHPTIFLEQRALNPSVAPGGVLLVEYKVNRQRFCHVVLEQHMFDSRRVRFDMPDEDFTASPGALGNDTFVIPVQVPLAAAEGPARYRAVRAYYCNPLQSWWDWPIVIIQDTEFKVEQP